MERLEEGAAPARSRAWKWYICGLLLLATMLNYMDRQALNQTSAFILAEFAVPADHRETVYGDIESAFAANPTLDVVMRAAIAASWTRSWRKV